MLAGVADHAFELVGHVHDFGGVFVALHELGQLLLPLHRLGERHADLEGNHLGEPIRQAERLALHPGHVAHHQPRRHGAEGDDLANRILAVALGDVGDHLFTAFHAEVDVEIGHGDPFRVQQALEQQVVFQGIQFRDAEAVGHQRCVAGTATAHRHAMLPPPVDELLDDEEIARELHLRDDAELVLQPFSIAFRVAVRARLQMPVEALPGALFQDGCQGGPGRHGIARQVVGAQLHGMVAASRHLDGVVERLRQIGEQLPHLRRRAQILLLAVAPLAARVVQHSALLDAHARLVRLEIVVGEEADIVGGHDRHMLRRRQRRGMGHEATLAGAAGAHHLQIDAIAERFAPAPEAASRSFAACQRRADIAGPAQQHQQPLGRGEDVVLAYPSVLAIADFAARRREGAGDEAQEIPIASFRGHQQDAAMHAVGILVVEVCADDRLDAGVAAGRIELHQAEQVGAIR